MYSLYALAAWQEKCLSLYKEKVQSLPPDERKAAAAAVEASLVDLASDPAVAKSPSSRMDLIIHDLERVSIYFQLTFVHDLIVISEVPFGTPIVRCCRFPYSHLHRR